MQVHVPKTCATCSFYRPRKNFCVHEKALGFVDEPPFIKSIETIDVRIDPNRCTPEALWWVFDPLWDIRHLDRRGVLAAAPTEENVSEERTGP